MQFLLGCDNVFILGLSWSKYSQQTTSIRDSRNIVFKSRELSIARVRENNSTVFSRMSFPGIGAFVNDNEQEIGWN